MTSTTTTPSVFFTTQDTVTFIFFSDGSSTFGGWAALIDCVPGGFTQYKLGPGSPTQTITCGSPLSFYDNGGPSRTYGELIDDTVTLVPPTSNDRLMAAFPYQLELGAGDTLWAYEDSLSTPHLVAIFTQGSSRAETLLTSGPGIPLIFRFKSDFDGNVGNGWGAAIACISGSPLATTYMGAGLRSLPCGISYRFYDSGSPGLITEGGRSDYGHYANNENRVLTFMSQNGAERLRLQFSSFNTESSNDWLEVYDGPTITSPLIGRWSGTVLPPTLLSSGAFLTVRFQTDGSVTRPGWVATVQCTGLPAPPVYSMTSATQTVTACSALFYDEGGPANNYTTFPQDRLFTFCPDNASTYLVVRFPYQFLLAPQDTLWVYEGAAPNPAGLVGLYVRRNIGEEIASQTPGACLTFRFKASATSTGAAGWHGIVECSATQQPSVTWMQGAGLRRSCNLRLHDDGGPNANYRHNANDSLLLVSPSGCGISIQFSAFATEANLDVLRIHHGASSAAPLIGQYSGPTTLPNNGNPIAPGGDTLFLRFFSDNSVNHTGWTALVSCPNTFSVSTTPTGTVQICRGSVLTLTASGAPSGSTYTWNTGPTGPTLPVSTPGTYFVTATAPTGCSATSAPVSVSYYPAVDTSIMIVGTTLSNSACGNPYTCTWINCGSNQIVGTGSTLTPTQSGFYALILQHPTTGCRDTSSCRYVDITTSAPSLRPQMLRLYPNPTSHSSIIQSPKLIRWVELWDLQGRQLFLAYPHERSYQLPPFPTGFYQVRIGLVDGCVEARLWQVE